MYNVGLNAVLNAEMNIIAIKVVAFSLTLHNLFSVVQGKIKIGKY